MRPGVSPVDIAFRSPNYGRLKTMTWTKPVFEVVELSSEVTAYRFTR
jgi:hypothetical protein